MLDNISYKSYKKRSDIHGTVLYPAVMVAPVQNKILNSIIADNNIESVFDPFYGSGTTLYETMKISPSIQLVGCDINPLANLITKVKLQGIDFDTFNSDAEKLNEQIEHPKEIYPYEFPNIEKWFRSDIAESIRIVRSAIIQVNNTKNRLFFWYMLCDVIRKYSNTRSSTYKLHSKDDMTILKMENNLIKDYIASITKNTEFFLNSSNNYILYKCDTLNKIKVFNNNIFDISITSPPYGDNATTVPYGQFSMLALYTIPKNDLELEGWELDNYSIIDKKSMGGPKDKITFSDFEKTLINPYLKQISQAKQRKVLNFFNDYFIFLNELCRVTNKYIALTLGNRTVDGIKINLTEITKIFLEYNHFVNVEFATREIPTKRIPNKTSKVNKIPVSSINEEYFIIHKRNT